LSVTQIVSATSQPAAFTFLTLATIMTEPDTPTDWLIRDILASGEHALVFGDSASFKSWAEIHMALCLAAGLKWLDTFEVPQCRRVLYCDQEMHPRTLKKRVKRLVRGLGIDWDDLPIRFLSRCGIRLNATGAEELLRRCDDVSFTPEVIIFDTYRRVAEGDENGAKDVSEFWRNATPLLERNIAVVVLHHARKPKSKKESAKHRASGSRLSGPA
jgi:RecA-family ATPase